MNLGRKLKMLKHAKNNFRSKLKSFYIKNGSKKHLILEKSQDFKSAKNGHYAKAIAYAK